jgi:NADH:ubiquinone oxidoreductase subunit 6 (subunit J)
LNVIIVVVQVGAVEIYVTAVEALRKKERQDETQFTTKIGGIISFCKIFIAITLLMAYYAETGRSRPLIF